MFTRRINVKPVIAVPVGSILPENLEVPVIKEGSFLEKLVANAQEKIAIVVLSTEELIALVEKPHLFGTDVVALVGVPGGRYDAVWSSYVAPLRRLSLDTLGAEVRRILDATSKASAIPVAKAPTVPHDTQATYDADTPEEGITE